MSERMMYLIEFRSLSAFSKDTMVVEFSPYNRIQ